MRECRTLEDLTHTFPMLHVDVSKLVPDRAYYYIAPVLPGLFFEVSVALANPSLAREFVAHSEYALWHAHYLTIFIALVIAFAAGFGATMFVSLLTWFLSRTRGFLASAWQNLCARALRMLSRPPKKVAPSPPRPSRWRRRLQYYFARHAFSNRQDFSDIQHCWRTVAHELLRQRYGFEELELLRLDARDWRVLYWTLALPTREERTPSITVIASHAAGWLGLAAARFAPILKNRWYIGFCSLLILSGLIYDYYESIRRGSPEGIGLMHTRALLRQFPKRDLARSAQAPPEPT